MFARALSTRQKQLSMLTILLTTACTQPAAEVQLNGQNRYGRDGGSSIASNSYRGPSRVVSQQTYQAASVSSIGVSDLSSPTASTAPVPSTVASSDLAPPSGSSSVSSADIAAPPSSSSVASTNSYSAPAPSGSPFAVGSSPYAAGGKPSEPAPAATNNNSSPVNLWTKQPHFSEESKNTTAKTAAEMKPAAGKAPQTAGALSAQPVKTASVANYMWPVSSKKVVTSFGPKGGGRVSDGIDIASSEGEPVWAASDGEIVFVGDELKGYGNMVLIKHEDGKTTTYAHLSRASVDKYDRVKQGDIIGYVGSTGNVRDPQLFFAINDGKTALDPQKYLSRNVAGL